MSYIRSTSNPEKLYIWGEGDGSVAITEGHEDILQMPTNIFHELLKRWYNQEFGLDDTDDLEVVKYKGASLELTKDFRWRLDYKTWERSILLFETTLVYICTQNDFRWGEKSR